MEYSISLYYTSDNIQCKTLDLCRGEDDYRKVYIVDDGKRKLVIKRVSNTFSDKRRIEGWFRLMEAYRKLGIYCPTVVPNRFGESIHQDTVDGRDYYTYAEEFAAYPIAEDVGEEHYKDALGHESFMPDVLRSLGKVASARLDVVDWPSAYCLLEPHSAPDTTDEATECAEKFADYIRENLPEYLPRTEELLSLFYKRQAEVREIYDTLPTSCFQADLNNSNILLDENDRFAGLIDFNLCGREPILNYAMREALWGVSDKRLFGEKDSRLYLYDKDLEALRMELFLTNMGYIGETYTFSEAEKAAFPILLRYMNSFWWFHLDEIARVHEDPKMVETLLRALEWAMTRDDIRLK